MYPFLHEDVLYLINEFARENKAQKPLCHEVFTTYLSNKLLETNIRYHWLNHILSIGFESMNDFKQIVNLSHRTFHFNNDIITFNTTSIEGDSDRIIYYDEITTYKLKKMYEIPLGPRMKLYQKFVLRNHV